MNKLEMAHEYAMLILGFGKKESLKNLVSESFDYADAMQAEADKRIDKSLPDVLNMVDSPQLEWQPDWSQAPEMANYWAIDDLGNAEWKYVDPKGKQLRKCVVSWDVENSLAWEAPTFNYQGNWQDSLRKRPE